MATSEEAVRAQDIAGRLAHGGLKEVQESIDEVFAEATLPQADRVSDWGAVLDTVGRVRDTLEVFRPEVFDIPSATWSPRRARASTARPTASPSAGTRAGGSGARPGAC